MGNSSPCLEEPQGEALTPERVMQLGTSSTFADNVGNLAAHCFALPPDLDVEAFGEKRADHLSHLFGAELP